MESSIQTRNYEVIASTYKSCYDNLLCYLMSYTHDKMAAEDMLQDIYMKTMMIDVISEETARNLVFVMAKRMIIDDARHKAFVRQQEQDLRQSLSLYDDFSVSSKIARDEIASMEGQILAGMPKKRALVYKMYRHEELTSREIADKLNLSKRTVESHIYNSTKEVRSKLKAVI